MFSLQKLYICLSKIKHSNKDNLFSENATLNTKNSFMNKTYKSLNFIFAFFTILLAEAQTVELTPLFHTIGVKVTNISGADSCKVEYSKAAQSNWQLAYDPDMISIDGTFQFRGSIFMLEENTFYDVRVTVYSGSTHHVLPAVVTTTLKSPLFSPSGNTKWVSPSGTGNYSENSPGNLSALFASGQVLCGTTIILKNGTYKIDGLQLTLNNNCTENSPIIITAEAGAKPIIDAGTIITSPWTSHASVPDLYSTPTPAGTSHSNICMLGNKALYPYPTLTADFSLGNYNLSELNFGYDGYIRDENTIWIKTKEGINPNDSIVTVSNAFRFITVYGNNKNAYLKVKGIEFRYFGKPVLNSPGSTTDSYSATVFDLRNVHHIYIDSCRFLYNSNNISFSNQCNHFVIQNSDFKHCTGKWTHAMIKKSHDSSVSFSSSRARNVENAAVFIDSGKSGVLRNSLFDGVNSGIESYIDIGLKEDIDIYDNTFIDNFDAIECDGLWSNLRVWKNEIIRPMAGISASPPLVGPRYFYRNLFHGMQGRRNEYYDPFFIGCSPVNDNYMGQGVAIKTNIEKEFSITPGNLYFFNNTFHASDTLGFVFTSWKAEWRKAIFINNIYSHTLQHPFFFFTLANHSVNGNFQITSVNDNYFSHITSAPIVKVKHIHGEYFCSDINEVSELQSTLRSISGSPHIVVQSPLQSNPFFLTTNPGDFELKNSSPMIDAGGIIQGFYDYNGTKPDIGAKENTTNVGVAVDYASNDINIYPNPYTNILYIHLPNSIENVSIKVINSLGQYVFQSQAMTGKLFEIDIENEPNGIYFIEVYTPNKKVLKKVIKMSQ